MKISFVTPSFYPAVIYGGPIFSSLFTLEELSKLSGIEVYVSTTNTNKYSKLEVITNKWIDFKNIFKIKYYNESIIDKISIPLILNLWKDIKNAEITHIQSIFSISTPVALLYSKILRKKILLSPRGSLGTWCINNGNPLKKFWLTFLIKPLIKNVIWHVTADMEKNEVTALFADSKIKVIPNGIRLSDYEHVTFIDKAQYLHKFTKQTSDCSHLIVSMGRIQKKKGFDILIYTFAEVLKVYPSAKLLIAGEDEGELVKLTALVSSLGLTSSVFFTGALSGMDKLEFLANADVFVLPSHNENFGNVYLESLASGTPIVASKNTPWAEVESKNCGRWVSNTIQDNFDAIMNLLSKDREQMRFAAKAYAKNFNWEQIAKQFKSLFDSMVANK